jgi:hypothetical protein
VLVLPPYLKVSPSLTLRSEEIRFTQHGSRIKDTPFSYMHIRKQKRAARLFTQRPKNLNKLASEKLGTLAFECPGRALTIPHVEQKRKESLV